MTGRMWGGRFAEGPDAIMEEINASIDFDKNLFRQDIAASQAQKASCTGESAVGEPRPSTVRTRRPTQSTASNKHA